MTVFDNNIDLNELKQLLFEVYSAGFEAGYTQEISIVEAYNNWWEAITEVTT